MNREWQRIENMRPHIERGAAIAIIWTVDDVLSLADGEDITLRPSQAREVLARMSSQHDAEVGINWDVILEHIQEVVGEDDEDDGDAAYEAYRDRLMEEQDDEDNP